MYFSIYDMYFMLPAIIVTLWAQFKVKSTFTRSERSSKYSDRACKRQADRSL